MVSHTSCKVLTYKQFLDNCCLDRCVHGAAPVLEWELQEDCAEHVVAQRVQGLCARCRHVCSAAAALQRSEERSAREADMIQHCACRRSDQQQVCMPAPVDGCMTTQCQPEAAAGRPASGTKDLICRTNVIRVGCVLLKCKCCPLQSHMQRPAVQAYACQCAKVRISKSDMHLFPNNR